MGVHGLTTYLHENTHAIAQSLTFSSEDSTITHFVVDGWSFIYEALAQADLPWVYGGEYKLFSEVVTKIVRAWLSVGLSLYFVFDGPYPEIKFPTIASRLTENVIKPSLLFFRTSPVSRSKPKFLRESAMLPPRAYAACIITLQNLQRYFPERLQLHFADEEGDPYAVELAARLGGYVVGKDSDFVILNAEGYKGYIPLDNMVWSSLDDDGESFANTDIWDDEDGFQPVINSKSRKKEVAMQKYGLGARLGQGIIPPEDAVRGLQLSVMLYSPFDLASHLQLPLSLLPLLGALIGNDYTGAREQQISSATTSKTTNLQWLFFDRQLTLSQRIARVASTLRDILNAALNPSRGKSREKYQVHSVMELIERAVNALTIRNQDHMSSSEKQRVVERIVEATLQYAIPKYEGDAGHAWASDVCALHEANTCPLVLLRPTTQQELSPQSPPSGTPSLAGDVSDTLNLADAQNDHVRSLLVSSYRSGHLDPHVIDILHSGTFWYRQFLEDPDIESVARTLARPIQLWAYALLDDIFGIPSLAQDATQSIPDNGDGSENESQEDDELVDVVEESSDEEDPLAPLKGVLQQLNAPDGSIQAEHDKSSSEQAPRPQLPRKVVKEYTRRGTRLAVEEVEVPFLGDLWSDALEHGIPIPLQAPEKRLFVLLLALGFADDGHSEFVALVQQLIEPQRIPALTLRWVLSRLHSRAQEGGGGKEREKERWTRHEAQAFLSAFDWSSSPSPSPDSSTLHDSNAADIPITDRNVQLVAQALATMDAIERLSQCLLLSSPTSHHQNDAVAILPSPTLRFSGRRFHAYLTSVIPVPKDSVSDALWQVSCGGLGEIFNQRGGKQRKKEKGSAATSVSTSPLHQSKGKDNRSNAVVGGKFGLLATLPV